MFNQLLSIILNVEVIRASSNCNEKTVYVKYIPIGTNKEPIIEILSVNLLIKLFLSFLITYNMKLITILKNNTKYIIFFCIIVYYTIILYYE